MNAPEKAHPIAARMSERWGRPLAVGLTLLAAACATYMVVGGVTYLLGRDLLAIDYHTHAVFARRFFETGSMYLPYQLTGPFNPIPEPHIPEHMPSMYPPSAIYLFAPFLLLPWVLWWAIPIGIVVYAFWRWKPRLWIWPILILLSAHSSTSSAVVAGNTNMWVAAFIAGGLLWGWPAALVLIKPSLAVFAVVGIRHRTWWLAAALLLVISIPLVGQWIAYMTVVSNAETSLDYSLRNWPILAIPVVAWLGRTREHAALPQWTGRRAAVRIPRILPEGERSS